MNPNQPSSSSFRGLGDETSNRYDRRSYDNRRSQELFTTAEISQNNGGGARPAGKMIFSGAVGTGGGPSGGLAPSKSIGRRPQIQGPQPQPLQPEMPPESPISPTTPQFSRYRDQPGQTSRGAAHPPMPPASSKNNRLSVISPGTTPTRENFNYLNRNTMRQSSQTRPNLDTDFDDSATIMPDTLNRVTSTSSRSIYIGFDPSMASSASTPSSGSSSNPVIPNFPPPPIPNSISSMVQQSNRRVSNASVSTYQSGPPPSRRGVSSYYQYLVQPIPEESSTPEYRHGSFASSHVIPSSWGSGPQSFWIPATNEELMSDVSSISDARSGRSGRDSRSPRSDIEFEDFDEGATLVRQASVGKKSRAKMTDIKRSDSTSRSPQEGNSSSESLKRGSVQSIRPPMPAMLQIANPSPPTESSVSPSTERLSIPDTIPMPLIPVPMAMAMTTSEPSPMSLEKPSLWKRFSRASTRNSQTSPRLGNGGPSNRMDRIEEPRYEKEKRDQAGGSYPLPTLKRPIPPRLNMEAVREAESRGSLTSLPDLIRRATKLAAVLETDRRPGSRWGSASLAPSNAFTDSSSVLGRHESMADILASFPPPVLAQGARRDTRLSAWPLPQDLQYQQQGYGRGGGNGGIGANGNIKRTRRICGLPLWAFILLVLVALAVITAAVVVPLQLVALSKANQASNDSKNANVAPTVQSCQKSNPCQNEGISVIQGNSCGCVCTNGFTGSNCELQADAACTSLPVPGTSQNITIGSAIPRLLSIAASQYNVPLNATTIVTTFGANNNTCTFQNSLVTFDGSSTRKNSPSPTSSKSPAPSSATEGTFVLNENVIDFSRVAVLFLVQEDTVEVAQQAQRVLQGSFDNGIDFGTITVDATLNAKVDLSNLNVKVGKDRPSAGGPVRNSNTTSKRSYNFTELMKRFYQL